MKIINLSKAHLAALLHTAGKQDIRYYLNGVCLDVLAGYSRLVSTDGHVLGVTHVPETFNLDGFPQQYIIPREAIEHFKPSESHPMVKLTILDGEDGILSDESGLSYSFKFIQGKYPDYTRVIAKGKPNGVAGQFQHKFYERWAKVAKVLGVSGRSVTPYTVHHNGPDQAALVQITGHRDYLGVMMPVRADYEYEKPKWL